MQSETFHSLQQHLNQQVIGQSALVEQLLVALLADGHILVEGPPGLAKTRAVKSLADCIEGDFHRIQFTPDLLPADLTGTDIFRPETGEFTFQAGPIFNSLVLADEINRAPAKVQAAMLEAMASGCLPLAPDRLAYREYVPDCYRYQSHEQDSDAEAEAAVSCLERMTQSPPLQCQPELWRASALVGQYRSVFDELIRTKRGR